MRARRGSLTRSAFSAVAVAAAATACGSRHPLTADTRRACLQQQAAPATAADVDGRELIDAAEIFEHIRDITDPEHPYSLEQLNVVEEELISVDDRAGHVK